MSNREWNEDQGIGDKVLQESTVEELRKEIAMLKVWYVAVKAERDLLFDESVKIHHEERPVRTENRLLKHENEALKAEIERLKKHPTARMGDLYKP